MKTYLMLMSVSQANAAAAQKLKNALTAKVDPKAAPLWIDSKGLGIFIESEKTAKQIWNACLDALSVHDREDFRDLLILEIGPDWMARPDAKTEHWLKAHLGNPQ